MNPVSAENLFRKQALHSLNRKRPGRPIGGMPRPWLWLGAILIMFVVGAVAFIINVDYSRKETVRGWLVSASGVVRVTHDVRAVVVRIAREPGEQVQQGDPLIYLSSDTHLSGGDSKNERVLDDLRREAAEIELQIKLSEEQERLEIEGLNSELQQSLVEMSSLEDGAEAFQDRVTTGRDKIRRLQNGAHSGAVSDWEVLSQSDALSSIEVERNRLGQSIANADRDRISLRWRLLNVPVRARIQRSLLRANRAQLAQKITAHEAARSTVLNAAIGGTVASIEVSPGNSVVPGQLLMTILPTDLDLAAEVYVPSRAAGFMQAGQAVRLIYDALPAASFGTFPGTVSRVSSYVLLPGEIPQTFPLSEATYKVRVELLDSSVTTGKGRVLLRPGMLLSAEIILESRNLVDWLLQPLRLHSGFAA